jgi:hypothetical protein
LRHLHATKEEEKKEGKTLPYLSLSRLLRLSREKKQLETLKEANQKTQNPRCRSNQIVEVGGEGSEKERQKQQASKQSRSHHQRTPKNRENQAQIWAVHNGVSPNFGPKTKTSKHV